MNEPKEDKQKILDEKIRQQINAKIREIYILSGKVDNINQRIDIKEAVNGERRNFSIDLKIRKNLEIIINFGGTYVEVTYKTKEWYKKLAELLFHMYEMLSRLDKQIYVDKLE